MKTHEKIILYGMLLYILINGFPNFIKGLQYIKHDVKYVYEMVKE